MANFGFGSALPLDQVLMPASAGYTPDRASAPAPAPQAPPPQAHQQPADPYKPSLWDIAQGMIFDSQSPAEAAMAARQRAYQAQTQQVMMDTLRSAAPDQRLAMLLNPQKLGEAVSSRFQSMALKAGETRDNGEGGPARFTAPIMSVDEKSGVGFTQTPTGITPTGQFGGDFSAKDGIIASGRTGQVAGSYAVPQILPPGSTPGSFTPALGGGAPQLPALAAPSAPTNAPSGPRGIRNLNFGNIRALPNGQKWDGQVGVDENGYAVFGDPASGAKAALTNLQSYAKQGVNTPSAIANRWAPKSDGNDPNAYAHYLAGKLGVGVNDKLDMSDAKVQQGLLSGIFEFENGPSAASAFRYQAKASPQQGGAGGWQVGAPTGQPRIVPPGDPRYGRFPAGTVLQQSPNGEVSVVQKPEYSPEAKTAIRDHVLSSDGYKQANAALAAYKAMIGNADKMTGPSAYSMLDTFARAINPGAVARPTVIETIEKNLGLPAQLVGSLESKFGQGNLPTQVRQQIIDAVVPFAQSHWDEANMLNQSNAALAKQHGFDAADVTAPLDPRPGRYIIGAGDPAAALAQAKAAIAKGAPRAAVYQRLHSMGVDPKGL